MTTTDGLGWLTERQRDGGVDRVAVPDVVPGEMWLCGKRAVATRYGDAGWDTIVCLVEPHEIAGHHPAYVAWLRTNDPRAVWEPVPDLHAPSVEVMDRLADEVTVRLDAAHRVLIHCAAGYGRSGTTAVCVLIALGVPVPEALELVSTGRPGAGPEVGAQRDLVAAFTAARSR